MEQSSEDRQIRNILITGGAAVVFGLLVTVAIIAVMVAYNFNFLNWME